MSFNNVLTELLTIAELGQNPQLRDVADRLHDAHNQELAEVKTAARHDKLVAEAFQAEIASTIKSNNRAKDSEYVKATYTKAELVAELNTQLGQILSNVHTEVMRAEGHPPCKTGGEA